MYALGDRWIRNDGIFELIRIDLDAYVFAKDTGEEIHLSRDLALVRFRSLGRSVLEFTPTPQLEWPLEVGRRGTFNGQFKAPHGDPYEAELQWAVEAFEPVTVPAGTFSAFRIRYTVAPLRAGGQNFARQTYQSLTAPPTSGTLVFWYAPEVRQFVKADANVWSVVRFELVALDPGEAEEVKVVVREPKDHTRIGPDETPALSAVASAGKGITSVTVTVNGKPVATEAARGELRRTLPVSVPLALRDGKNIILVTATDATGTSSQEARVVFYSEPVTVVFPASGHTARASRDYIRLAIPPPPPALYCVVSVALNEVVVQTLRCDETVDGMLMAQMRLPAGQSQVRVRYDRAGEQEIQERTLVYEPAGAGPQVAATGAAAADEDRRRAEEQRLAEEKKRVEQERLAEEQRQRQEAQRLAEEDRRREQARVAEQQRQRDEAAALPPLQLTLSSPRDQARFENDSIGLAGLVAGGKGVSRVTVALNGVEVKRQDEPTPQRAVALSLPITLREGQNTLVVTATEVDGTISQDVRTVFYEKPQPLTVAMRFPQDQMRVTDAATVAAAIVSSSKGVARVGVTLNGVEVHQQADRTPTRSQLVTVPLKLQPGVNVVAVIAADTAGAVRQEVRTVIFDAPAAVATPAVLPAPPPSDRWAVVIGVGEYEHPSIPRLRYTVNDAETIYETLIGPVGFKKEHVLLLTDRADKKPTLKNIKWALGTFLARSARKDDTVLIFFAGHGAPETDPRGLERDGLAKYLIPADAELDDLYSSALPMDELQTIFGRIEAERVVAFIDACYSGAAGGRTFSARRTRAAGIDDLFLERLTRSKGRAIITASRPAEVSIELAELGHGIFTYYLIEGLKGAADLNRDGIISLQELYEYVEQQVATKSRAVGGNQHPIMKGELEGILPLTKVTGGR